jgi:hypothetical protein
MIRFIRFILQNSFGFFSALFYAESILLLFPFLSLRVVRKSEKNEKEYKSVVVANVKITA